MRARFLFLLLSVLLSLAASCAPKYQGPYSGEQGVTFRFNAPGAKTVFLIGSFNRWDPDLYRMSGPDKDGWWSITVSLGRGRYEYLFLVNSSELVLDPFVPMQVKDGYGGKNSVIYIK